MPNIAVRKTCRSNSTNCDFALANLVASDKAYVELDIDDLDLPAGLLPQNLSCVTVRQVAEAVRQHNLAQLHVEPVFLACARQLPRQTGQHRAADLRQAVSQAVRPFRPQRRVHRPAAAPAIARMPARHVRHWLSLEWNGEPCKCAASIQRDHRGIAGADPGRGRHHRVRQ